MVFHKSCAPRFELVVERVTGRKPSPSCRATSRDADMICEVFVLTPNHV
jgi:hypothetical protein